MFQKEKPFGWKVVAGQPWRHTPKRILAEGLQDGVIYCFTCYHKSESRRIYPAPSWIPIQGVMANFPELYEEFQMRVKIDKYDQMVNFQTQKDKKIKSEKQTELRIKETLDEKNLTVSFGGKINIQVKHADITKEKVCAIVNPSNKRLESYSAISKAI